jgi:hypothetical protein
MLNGENIICFSVTDYGEEIPLGKDHLMETYSQNGNKVLMINVAGTRAPTISKYDLNKIIRKLKSWFRFIRVVNKIYVITPPKIPFVQYPIVNKLNSTIMAIYLKLAMHKLEMDHPIVFSLSVFYTAIIKNLNGKAVVYYISDDYSLFSGNDRSLFLEKERKFSQYCDGAITVSNKLFNDKKSYVSNMLQIKNATNPNHFLLAQKENTPADIKHIPEPIIGFSGKIEDWVDIDLVRSCALKYPLYSFLLIGPQKINIDLLKKCTNVFLLGQKKYSELPNYLTHFDLSILPFKDIDRMKTVDIPLTLQEYFAVGKPIAAININKNSDTSDLCFVAENKNSFIEALPGLLNDHNADAVARRQEFARSNSWENRAIQISNWIQTTIIDHA